jgi:hypothetical protein
VRVEVAVSLAAGVNVSDGSGVVVLVGVSVGVSTACADAPPLPMLTANSSDKAKQEMMRVWEFGWACRAGILVFYHRKQIEQSLFILPENNFCDLSALSGDIFLLPNHNIFTPENFHGIITGCA